MTFDTVTWAINHTLENNNVHQRSRSLKHPVTRTPFRKIKNNSNSDQKTNSTSSKNSDNSSSNMYTGFINL